MGSITEKLAAAGAGIEDVLGGVVARQDACEDTLADLERRLRDIEEKPVPPPPPPPEESPDGATTAPGGPPLLVKGTRWALDADGRVTRGGAPHGFTAGAVTLLRWQDRVWHENLARDWYPALEAEPFWGPKQGDPRIVTPPTAPARIGICISASGGLWTRARIKDLAHIIRGPWRVSIEDQMGSGSRWGNSRAREIAEWLLAEGRRVELCFAFRHYNQAGPNYLPWMPEILSETAIVGGWMKASGAPPSQLRAYPVNEPRGDIGLFRTQIAPKVIQAFREAAGPDYPLVLCIPNDDDPDTEQNWSWWEPLLRGDFPGWGDKNTYVDWHGYFDMAGGKFSGQGTKQGDTTRVALPTAFTDAFMRERFDTIQATARRFGYTVVNNEAGASRFAYEWRRDDWLRYMRAYTRAAIATGMDLSIFEAHPGPAHYDLNFNDPDVAALFD